MRVVEAVDPMRLMLSGYPISLLGFNTNAGSVWNLLRYPLSVLISRKEAMSGD